jgi:hypothetical protein
MKKLTVIGIKGYTQGVRQVAKPTPKAIKKKLKIESSSFLGSSVAEMDSVVVVTESVETKTGAETSSFAVSVAVAAMATVLATVGMVFSSCFSLILFSSSAGLAASDITSSSLFFFRLLPQTHPFLPQS